MVALEVLESARENLAEQKSVAFQLKTKSWEAYNTGLNAPVAEPYEEAGRRLLEESVSVVFEALKARGDLQDEIIEAGLRGDDIAVVEVTNKTTMLPYQPGRCVK